MLLGNLSSFIFPKKTTRSHWSTLNLRLKQLFTLLVNSISDLFNSRFQLHHALDAQVLIVIPGHKISEQNLTKCPTCLRLLELANSLPAAVCLNDPLTPYPRLAKITKYSFPLLLNIATRFDIAEAVFHYWTSILSKLKPKLIIGLMPNYQICRAAYMFNIPIADIQHGVIQREHDWYKNIISRKDVTMAKLFPSDFFVWDTYSKNVLLSNPLNPFINSNRIHIIGYNSSPINNDSKSRSVSQTSSCNNILVTCSYNFEGIYLDSELIHIDEYRLSTKPFVDFIKSSKGYNFRFRLHPSAKDNSLYSRQLNGISQLRRANKANYYHVSHSPLLEDLAWLDLHVTLHSSVAIDLIPFNKPTIFLCPAQNRFEFSAFRHYSSNIFFVYPGQDIADCIKDLTRRISLKDFGESMITDDPCSNQLLVTTEKILSSN